MCVHPQGCGHHPTQLVGLDPLWWGEVVAQGQLGAGRNKVSPGTWRKWDGAAGAEVSQQLAVISTAGSAEMSQVQPHLRGNGRW